ncbi:hypothetical protein Pcinc_013316 [Petrolisthes cinctipes]|uniref:Uncharacterized protein n=1 Tax=Petrolisthes cinctipes TaxID=88211 RepID=A0AAE1KUG3_PETCI|nr:hypothetical protein Pcinc_013316 [Petrolisthes cinctipes]
MAEVFWPLSILSKTFSFCSRVKVFLDLFDALPSATEVEGRLGAMVKLRVKQNLPQGKSAKRAGDSCSQHQDVGNNECVGRARHHTWGTPADKGESWWPHH